MPNNNDSRSKQLHLHLEVMRHIHGCSTKTIVSGMFNREVASTGSLEKTSDFVFFLPFLLSPLFARRHNTREERQQAINRRCETDMVRMISYDTYDRI
jgi:hypothetical protein